MKVRSRKRKRKDENKTRTNRKCGFDDDMKQVP